MHTDLSFETFRLGWSRWLIFQYISSLNNQRSSLEYPKSCSKKKEKFSCQNWVSAEPYTSKIKNDAYLKKLNTSHPTHQKKQLCSIIKIKRIKKNKTKHKKKRVCGEEHINAGISICAEKAATEKEMTEYIVFFCKTKRKKIYASTKTSFVFQLIARLANSKENKD